MIMKKSLLVVLTAIAMECMAQPIAPAGCGGVIPLRITNTSKFVMNGIPDTVYLPISGSVNIRANYNNNCKLLIPNLAIDWIRNDTLVASGTPTYNIGINGYSILTVSTPGVYKTFFKGYYNSPADPGSDLLYVLPAQSTGVVELNRSKFRIYPNPARNNFIIERDDQVDRMNIRIYNSFGEMVLETEYETPKAWINTNGLAEGIYFLVLTDLHGATMVEKMIIQN